MTMKASSGRPVRQREALVCIKCIFILQLFLRTSRTRMVTMPRIGISSPIPSDSTLPTATHGTSWKT